AEMLADERCLPGKRCLRDGGDAASLGSEEEGPDIGAAIDRAIDAERLVRRDDRDVRRAEEAIVLERLAGAGRAVAAGGAAGGVVELEAAFAATGQVDAAIFAREREVGRLSGARRDLSVDRVAEALGRFARCHDHLPGLAVAPRGGALREAEHALDRRARHWVG